MQNLREILSIGILSLSVCLLSTAYALAGGSLDPSFGNNGLAITDFGIGDDEAFDLVVQDDGKIIVAGFSYNGAVKNFAVSRYLPDGVPDNDFGVGGTATFSLGSGDSVGRALAVQDDGKIIIAGSTGADDQDIALLRLNSEGSLDDSFGTNGQFVLSKPDSDARVEAVAVTADGAILLAGSEKEENTPVSTLLVKLNGDGAPEYSFGDEGVATIKRSYNTSSHALTLLDDGKILVAGSSSSNGGYAGTLLRFNADGSLDSGFGINGESELDMTDRDAELFDLLVLEDGEIAATGYVHNGAYREPVLARFDDTGNLNSDFGEGGIVYSDLGYDGITYSIVEKDNGSLLMTGYQITPSGKDMILIEIDGSGTIIQSAGTENDEAEGITELVSKEASVDLSESDLVSDEEYPSAASQVVAARYLVTDLGSDDDVSRAIGVTAEGAIVTAGYTSNGTDTDIALVRYTAGDLPETAKAIGDSAAGRVTGQFFIQTLPVFNITRNSAASGGVISARVSEQYCENYCEAKCENDSDATCETSCLEDCVPQVVSARGVVYSIVPYPSYRTADADDDGGDGEVAPAGLFPENSFDTSYNYEVVRSGQTADGAGVGEFGSDISEITPDVLYYVRAYAILQDETVIYGNQVSFRTNDSCFIATAAYGSILDKHVVILRQFRDQILQNYVVGRKLIAVYYNYSPELADFISRHEGLRKITRIALLPIIGLSYLLLHSSLLAILSVLLLLSLSMLSWKMLIRIKGENTL